GPQVADGAAVVAGGGAAHVFSARPQRASPCARGGAGSKAQGERLRRVDGEVEARSVRTAEVAGVVVGALGRAVARGEPGVAAVGGGRSNAEAPFGAGRVLAGGVGTARDAELVGN